MKMYCTECGTPMEYTSAKPKFCINCGYNFVTKAKAAPDTITEPKKNKSSNNDQKIDPDSEEFDVKELDPRIHDMNGLDVDIQVIQAKPLTFGDLFPDNEQEKNSTE